MASLTANWQASELAVVAAGQHSQHEDERGALPRAASRMGNSSRNHFACIY